MVHTLHTDEQALVAEHLPLVNYAVAELAAKVPRHVPRDDLFSAAMLGLAQAARTFDAARGLAFDRYAKLRIRGALLDELRGRDWATRSVRALTRRIDAATDELTAVLGRPPREDEVAAHLGVDVASLQRHAGDVHRATLVNYEGVFVDGESDALLPGCTEPAPEELLLQRERLGYLRDAVLALPERLARVVMAYYFEERTLQQIADEFGVTESRVSQMRADAMTLLRNGMNAHLDPDLLPAEARPDGRAARRKAAYYEAVGSTSSMAARLDAAPLSPAA